MIQDLGETVCLVTGANRGIGREVCRQLAGRGHSVVLTARSADVAATAAHEAGAEPLRLDVTDPASVVWAATLPDSGPTGGFFRDGRPLPW